MRSIMYPSTHASQLACRLTSGMDLPDIKPARFSTGPTKDAEEASDAEESSDVEQSPDAEEASDADESSSLRFRGTAVRKQQVSGWIFENIAHTLIAIFCVSCLRVCLVNGIFALSYR